MEPEKLDNRNNFHNIIKQLKEVPENCSVGKSFVMSVLEIDELFLFFNENFNEFYQQDNFRVVLAFVHRCIKVWSFRGDYLKDDIGILLANFLLEHNGDENDTKIALQIVYQVLNSIKVLGCNDIEISEKLLRELAKILLLIESRVLASNCIACMEKYMEMFPESLKNLESLWSNLKERIDFNTQNGLTKEVEIDILMQLFDRFEMIQYKLYDEPILINTIHHFLKSDQRKLRKNGIFLLKKFSQSFIQNVHSVAKMWMAVDQNEKIERSWTVYITVLENLEEEQSHLILPWLENLEELVKSHYLSLPWINILLMRLLTHSNNLVLRWSIEFVLKTFSSNYLCEDTLKHLLKATNCNLLFNYEGYFLKDEYFSSFLKGNVTILLKLFSEIENWKSLPLFKWLKNINNIEQLEKSLSFNDILKLSVCIRNCQHRLIRLEAIKICNLIFKEDIEKMSTKEYVLYIKTLYNSGDFYCHHKHVYDKISSITNSEWDQTSLLSYLKYIPVQEHGWLKYALFKYELKVEERNCINNLYKLYLNSLARRSIHEVIKQFQVKLLGLPPYDIHELEECNKAAIAFYIHEKPDFLNEDEAALTIIINSGIRHYHSLETFTSKFLKNNTLKINSCFIDELLNHKTEEITCFVIDYLLAIYDDNSLRKYANIIINQIALNQFAIKNVELIIKISDRLNLLKEVTDAILKILPSQGEKRIEDLFIFKTFPCLHTDRLKSLYLLFEQQIKRYNSESFANELINNHLSITERKPRYFENSIEHRVKLRIAVCIFHYFHNNPNLKEILKSIWNILLNENNQLNVTYIYEFILGKFESNENIIMEKLTEAKNLTSSQQVSIISVVFIYSKFRGKVTTKIRSNLLSLSMGANFQTRFFAQLSLYTLLKDCGSYFSNKCEEQIRESIQDAAGDKIEDYLKDIRLNFLKFSDYIISAIIYITNVPFDEFNGGQCIPREVFDAIESCSERYKNKLRLMNAETTTSLNEVNDHIQRKMNPIKDLTEPHSLIVYPTEKQSSQIYVVASLIDKLQNLGGIARTCEVLGIKNLVMDSKMHTEKNEFKNLSMTAEKNLNIHEIKPKDLKDFLILKKLEGFSIVGAEQTCKSQSFNDFKFPEKCVLLLGHEKYGISAPLLGFLDCAVEIPQFGQVRSLNVHVAGALFMWEYCKQHLITK